MANNGLKINAAVDAVIRPIVSDMTRIDITQKTNPLIGSHNEPDYIKERKKECVHIIFVNGEYRIACEKNADGEYYCRACGRKINTKFDEESVKALQKSVEIINQLLLFGMLNGLRAEPIASLISLKRMIPAAVQLLSELNQYVSQENKSGSAANNIGIEYAPKSGFNGGFTPITQYT